MYQSLDLFQTAAAMAQHAGARQAVVAKNIANADTPGFVAQQTAPFDKVYDNTPAGRMRATRAGHLSASSAQSGTYPTMVSHNSASPNGNSVSLEEEMLNAVSVSREHNRALTIYRHTMNVLRTALGRT